MNSFEQGSRGRSVSIKQD